MLLAIFASQTLSRENIKGKGSKVFLFFFTAVAGVMGFLITFSIFLEWQIVRTIIIVLLLFAKNILLWYNPKK